ncbi:MAG: J domain-containing protein [Terrimicrobiaceae bacterium]
MALQFRDYYEVLGVPKSATADEIRTAFRKLARKFHPDVAADKKSAEEKFKEINEAYEVLGDEEKRRKYDEFGAHWQAGGATGPSPRPTNWGPGPGGVDFEFGGTGFSDFFEHLFGTRRTSQRQAWWESEPAGPARGQDIESDLLVSLEEAFHGSTRRISFRRGQDGRTETYTVKIPKGVRQGQRIRLAGVGGKGPGGDGDLYLKIRYERHPLYEVSGSDLIHEVEVPAWDVVLGCEVEVPTLEGPARLKVPAGTPAGKRFRLAGRGLPAGGGSRGDYYAVLHVTLPTTPPSGEERTHWQRIAELNRQ